MTTLFISDLHLDSSRPDITAQFLEFLATDARGAVTVSLPARWNLCKAQGIDQAGELKAGDRVRATGTVDAQGALLVCEQPTHRIERLSR